MKAAVVCAGDDPLAGTPPLRSRRICANSHLYHDIGPRLAPSRPVPPKDSPHPFPPRGGAATMGRAAPLLRGKGREASSDGIGAKLAGSGSRPSRNGSGLLLPVISTSRCNTRAGRKDQRRDRQSVATLKDCSSADSSLPQIQAGHCAMARVHRYTRYIMLTV